MGVRYGRAQSLDRMAEQHKNNALLDKAIEAYEQIITENGPKMTDEFYKNVTKRCIDMMRFRGIKIAC